MEATESDECAASSATPFPAKPHCLLKTGAAIVLIAAVIFILLRTPLLENEAFLPFDSRLFAPYSVAAPPDLSTRPENMIYSDLPGWTMPERLVTLSMMDEGIDPLWTPYTLGGLPLLASLAYPIHYPLNRLLEKVPGLDPYKALIIQTFLNLVIAGAGMFLFLRLLSLRHASCFLGAICLSLSAWFMTHTYIPIFLNSAAWVPLFFWAAEKTWKQGGFALPSLLPALFTGCSLLGGFPQATLIGLYGAGCWILFSALFRNRSPARTFMGRMKPVLSFALAAGVGVGISLVQLLPAVELKDNSMRDSDYPLAYYKENALEAPSLLGQFLPGLFGHPVNPEGGGGFGGNVQEFPTYRLFLDYNVQNNIMENALFIGVIPFFLAIGALARRRGRRVVPLLAAMALMVLVIVLGTPLMDLCYRLVPGFSVGSPKRWLLLYTFALAALAAIGMDGFVRHDEEGVMNRGTSRLFTLLLLGIGAGGIAALTVGFGPLGRAISQWWMDRAQTLGIEDLTEERISTALGYLKTIAWPAVGATLVLGLARIVQGFGFPGFKRAKSWVPAALIVATCAELLWFGNGFIISQPRDGQYPATETTDFIVRSMNEDPTRGPTRVVSFNARELLVPDPAAVHGVQSVGGVSGLIPRRYGELCHALDEGLINMEDPRFISSIMHEENLDSPLVDLLGVRYIAIGKEADVPVMQRHGFDLAFRNDNERIALYENKEALPRAFVATTCLWASDRPGGSRESNEESTRQDGTTQDTGTRETRIQNTGTHNTGIQNTGTQGTGTQDTGTQDTGIRDTETPHSRLETAREEALARIIASGFDPEKTVALEIPRSDRYAPCPDPRGRKPEVRWERYSPLELIVRADMHDARGFLVVTDTYYPGWKAWVDDEPAGIERADYAFRAVFLDEGSHTIRFSYQPETYANGLLGSWIFLAIAGLWGCGIVWHRRRNNVVTHPEPNS